MPGRTVVAVVIALLLGLGTGSARAEKSTLCVIGQYGISYLSVMLMEHNKAVEARAREAGLGEVKVTWDANAGPAGANDALLSGACDISGVGLPSLVTLWARTKGTAGEIRSLGAMQSMPFYLLSRNPAVTRLEDFSERDRIAVPSVKISVQAIALQMAAAKAWGIAGWEKLDPLTVSLAHPDAAAAVLSGRSEVNAHFAVAPFHRMEMADPAVHLVMTSYDIMGRHSGGVLLARAAFVRDNPKLYAAFRLAQDDVNRFIRDKPREAAGIYLAMSGNKRQTVDELVAMITDPLVAFTATPEGVMTQARFLRETGRVKEIPDHWSGYFFPDLHNLPGS